MLFPCFAFPIIQNPLQKETFPLELSLLKPIPEEDRDWLRRRKGQRDGYDEELEGKHRGREEERGGIGMCPNRMRRVQRLKMRRWK